MRASVACAAWLPVVVAARASADPDPSFAMLDRQDDVSRVGAELSYLVANASISSTPTLIRGDLHAQYVDRDMHLGGYVSVPFVYSSTGSETGGSANELGNVELGGIWCPHLDSPHWKLAVHAGFTLPTTWSSDDAFVSGPAAAAVSRLVDLYDLLPNAVSLRVGVSPIYRDGVVFARVDLGVDVNFSNADATAADSLEHLDFGFGAIAGRVAVMGEIVNVFDGSSSDSSISNEWIDTGALSVRYLGTEVSPYAAIVLPLDSDSRQVMKSAITVGLDAWL